VHRKKQLLTSRGAMNNAIQEQQQEPEELTRIRKELEALTQKVEELGSEGHVDEAQELLNQMELLKKQQETFQVKAPKEQQLIVCDVCAATLCQNETDQRLSDHFAGKAHLGYQKIRDKIPQLRKMLSEGLKERPSSSAFENSSKDINNHYSTSSRTSSSIQDLDPYQRKSDSRDRYKDDGSSRERRSYYDPRHSDKSPNHDGDNGRFSSSRNYDRQHYRRSSSRERSYHHRSSDGDRKRRYYDRDDDDRRNRQQDSRRHDNKRS